MKADAAVAAVKSTLAAVTKMLAVDEQPAEAAVASDLDVAEAWTVLTVKLKTVDFVGDQLEELVALMTAA